MTIDGGDRITAVEHAPVVFTQEHVHSCTLMLTKRVGAADCDVKISYPIDRVVQRDWYRRRPYSAVSPYYANCFRVFSPGKFRMMMYLAAKHATPAGVMCHVGADETDARFEVNRSVLEPKVREMLAKVRARPDAP